MSEYIESLMGKVDDNERNIYILSGVFGGTIGLLIILVGVLFYMASSLKARAVLLEQSLEHLLRINHNAAELGPQPRKIGGGPPQRPDQLSQMGYGGNGPRQNQWGGPASTTSSYPPNSRQGRPFMNEEQQQMARQVFGDLRDAVVDEAKDAAKEEAANQFKSFF